MIKIALKNSTIIKNIVYIINFYNNKMKGLTNIYKDILCLLKLYLLY